MSHTAFNTLMQNKWTLLAALVLLGAVAAMTWSRPSPADADPYHQAVAAAADPSSLPYEFGTWVGKDVDVPPSAIQLLQPNVLISRQYHDPVRGLVAHFVLVQTRDARSLIGHYPPNCYPSVGWAMADVDLTQWTVRGHEVPGTEYLFTMDASLQNARKWVANFMVLPGGEIVPNMEGVTEAEADYRRRFFGAAQVQVVLPGGLSQDQRDQVVREMLAGHWGLIQAVRSGGRWLEHSS